MEQVYEKVDLVNYWKPYRFQSLSPIRLVHNWAGGVNMKPRE